MLSFGIGNSRGELAMAKYRQSYSNSCGAVALMCALAELGVTEYPAVKWESGGAAQPAGAFQPNGLAEMRIYGQVGTGVTQRLADRGYSMPAQLAMMARTFGLPVPTIYITPSFYGTMLTTFYSKARENAQALGIPVVDGPMPVMDPWQRALRVVSVMKVVGLHYVLERPGGGFMDPADGEDFASFAELNASWLKFYTDTGISILLTSEWHALEPLI